MERAGEGKQYKTATGMSMAGDTAKNGHWREQVRGHGTERPLERLGEEREYRTATGETR